MLLGLLLAPAAHAFCGVYVGSDSPPSNRDSSAVLTVYGGRITLTVSSDFARGEKADPFGLLIPVPAGIVPADVKTIPMADLDQLEDYTAPRTALYDCSTIQTGNLTASGCGGMMPAISTVWGADEWAADAIDVERFAVGGYDVALLEGDDADPLLGWLDDNGFLVPDDAVDPLSAWIEDGGALLAARVGGGDSDGILDPLQLSYVGDALSMPMVLGTTSSGGMQDLLMHVILPSGSGAASIANYPEVTVQDDCLLKDELGPTYDALLDEALVPVEGRAPWTTEYVGNVDTWQGGSCDPQVPAVDGIQRVVQTFGFLQGESTITRMRMRYAPEEVDEDLVILPTYEAEPVVQRYIVAPEVVEAYEKWPVCGTDEPVVPMELTASCEDSDLTGSSSPTQTATCATPGAATGVWLGLLPLALLRRRR